MSRQRTHAKVKLSTFLTCAAATPPTVTLVKAVLANVAFPYQGMAEMAAYPPIQLQL